MKPWRQRSPMPEIFGAGIGSMGSHFFLAIPWIDCLIGFAITIIVLLFIRASLGLPMRENP